MSLSLIFPYNASLMNARLGTVYARPLHRLTTIYSLELYGAHYLPKCALITVQSGLFNNEQMKAHKNIIAGPGLYMVWQGTYTSWILIIIEYLQQ